MPISPQKTQVSPNIDPGPRIPGKLSFRYLVIGVSCANLCYVKIWSSVLSYGTIDTYLMKSGASPTHIYALIANTLLLGAAIALAACWLKPRVKGAGIVVRNYFCLLALLVPLNAVRSLVAERWPHTHWSALTSALGVMPVLVLGGLAALAAFSQHRRAVRLAQVLLLLCSPLAVFNIVHGVLKAAQYDPGIFADKPLAPRLADARVTPRIVWIIFDEWDERLTFLERDPSIHMPELDRFRSQALYAANAYPPSWQTPWSLPALLTGRLVADAKPRGPSDLRLFLPAPQPPVTWRDLPNTFSEARALRYNVGVVGYYHPYCRQFNDSLSACSWWPTALQYNSMGNSFREVMWNQVRSLFETGSRSPFGQSLAVQEHGREQQNSLAAAKELVQDPQMGFVFLHFPVPHAPYAYDRRTRQFTLRSPSTGYWDNLALLDEFVGQLRATMEAANLWDGSTVLLSSDHWYRASVLLDGKRDHRVPFLLKMPGQHEGLTFSTPFNTVLSHDLILAILHGEIADGRGAGEWIDRHRTIAESPYYSDEIPF